MCPQKRTRFWFSPVDYISLSSFFCKNCLTPSFMTQKLLQTLPHLIFVLHEFLFSYMYITLLLRSYSFSLSQSFNISSEILARPYCILHQFLLQCLLIPSSYFCLDLTFLFPILRPKLMTIAEESALLSFGSLSTWKAVGSFMLGWTRSSVQ